MSWSWSECSLLNRLSFVFGSLRNYRGILERRVCNLFHGRGDWVRTSDLLFPKQARYQTAPHPATKTYFFIVSTRNSKRNLIRYPERQFQIDGGSSDEPEDRSLSLQSEFQCGSYPVCSATPALSYSRRCLASGFHPLDC